MLRGKCAPKIRNFLVRNFQKNLKMLFWPVFIQNFASGAENLAKQDLYSALGRLGNSFWWTLKKSTKYSIFFFENPPPPLEKNLDQPLVLIKQKME